jgi:hypothetical protein
MSHKSRDQCYICLEKRIRVPASKGSRKYRCPNGCDQTSIPDIEIECPQCGKTELMNGYCNGCHSNVPVANDIKLLTERIRKNWSEQVEKMRRRARTTENVEPLSYITTNHRTATFESVDDPSV